MRKSTEAIWAALVARQGAPLIAHLLHDEDQQEALEQRRVLVVESRRDGFGSGDVTLRSPSPGSLSPPLVYGSRDHVWTSFLVFPDDLGLTEDELAHLHNAWTPWESMGDMPGLEHETQRWALAEWTLAMRAVCPGYAAHLPRRRPSPHELARDPRQHGFAAAQAIAEDLASHDDARAKATLEVVARSYPRALDPEGPQALLSRLLTCCMAQYGGAQGARDALEALLPPALLRPHWENVVTEWFSPPHDPSW